MNNKAAIDIGSNTILLLIMNSENKQLEFEARVTSLGKNLDKNKEFEQTSMQSSLEALREYSVICHKYGIDFPDVSITATEASRVARNAVDFFKDVYNKLGATISVISGEKEAYYASYGVVRGENICNQETLTIMDIGGGSTELINVQTQPFRILNTVSIPLGSVRVSDWIENKDWEKKKKELVKNYDFNLYKCHNLIGVAGTMTSLINMATEDKKQRHFRFLDFDKSRISKKQLIEKIDKFKNMNADDFLEMFPYLGKRSSAIWGGYQVCRFICEQIEPESIQVSFKGLVHGVLLSLGNES